MADQNKFDTTHWDVDSVHRESQGEPEKPRREKKKKINWLAYIAFVLIVSALLAGIGWLLANDLCALNKKPLTATITVDEGDSLGKVASKLKKAGLIEYKGFFMMVLNVGQGECVLLYSGKTAALIDCGSSGSTDPGAEAADLLATMGIHRLTYVMLTHYHADHTNGMENLLARVPVDRLLLPDIEDKYGVKDKIITLADTYQISASYVESKTEYSLGEASLTVFPPVGDGDLNERGISALCSLDHFDALITGDMDGTTEGKLTSEFQLPDTEVLLVGHHGSKYSSSTAFLDTIKPEVAVISVGKNNSYGQPTDAVLERLQKAGAEVYRTDRQGNIMIAIQKGDP